MTDGSLFNLDALETRPVAEPSAPEPYTPTPSSAGTTPAARDAAAPRSLYRKYRPQSFDSDDLFGQEHIVNTLRNAIALDRIAHAYLFCGPRGTGKTTTARLLAKAVNCLDPDPGNRPCNQCEACIAINTGASTDVIEIDAASNRGIDDIRDLRERVKYAPSQLQTKFYIIDEAHQITGAAANAFLKTLEEPPAHTKFILATTDPEELLQTIVSRCQRFDFRRISLDAMTACLAKVAAAENIDIDQDAKTAIARHATGSMRDALGLLDQIAVYRERVDDEGTRVTVDLMRTVLGVSKNERVEEIATALADRDAGAGLRVVGQAVEAGDDIRQLARQLLAYLRLLLLERAGGTSDLDETGKVLAKRFELGELAELTRLMGEIDFKVKHATISQLPLEIAIVEGALRGQHTQQSADSQDRRTAPSAPQAQEERSQYTPPTAAPQPEPIVPKTSWRDKVRGEDRGSRSASPERPREEVKPPGNETPPPPWEEQPTQPAPERVSASAPVTVPTPAVLANGALQLEAVVDGWGRIKADVKAVNRRIEALLQQIDPIAINGNKITLVTPYEFHRNRVNTDEVRAVIEEVIARQFGAKVTVGCITRSEWSSTPQIQQAPSAQEPDIPQPRQSAASPGPQVEGPPAVEEATDPPQVIDTERQIEAMKNIFDAEIEETE
ncbi:MAG TPA: DNA polymerase III subunit gamma/tau [Thermomicrobiales bacterium]|nr:DNA polymerase III subunit gamma/tau [Thermomicrobiales bacterium]